MRLLQVSTGMGEQVDLHPRVTVVTHLDGAARQHLTDAVTGLAQGVATSDGGLLEAHGVLFDLSVDLLALLDISAGEVHPIVAQDDLPGRRVDPRAAERSSAQQTLALIEARWRTANDADAIARAAVDAAAEAVAAARLALETDDRSARERTPGDGPIDRRQELVEQLARLAADREAAAVVRAEVESAADEARGRREEAVSRCAAVAARLDLARSAIDDDAEAIRDAALAELAEVEAAVEAERRAEEQAADQAHEAEPTAERVEELDAEIEALERRRAAFGPAETGPVADLVEQVRSTGSVVLVPVPEAMAIVEELEALDAQLVGMEAAGGTPGGALPEARARLDAARQALVEAEQAARAPVPPRDTVEHLEQVHLDLLNALDQAAARFGRARAARRVEALRADERAILDELGFTSYADYVMGGMRRRPDGAAEAVLQAARVEATNAEVAWNAMEAETEAELTRAEKMERRRVLIEDARALLGRPVPPGAVITELRALQVEAEPSPVPTTDLHAALDDAGVAVGDEPLDRDDLLLVADAWISEAGGSAAREQELVTTLDRLREERAAAIAALEAATESVEGSDEAARAERLAVARRQTVVAEDRLRAHLVSEENAAFLADELTVARALEAAAASAAAISDAEHVAAIQRDEELRAAHERAEAELAAIAPPDGAERHPRDELVTTLSQAEADHDAAMAKAAELAGSLSILTAQRRQATTDLAAVPDDGLGSDSASLVEEVEWYLLARLAAQRSVSLAGSLPLVLDDALGVFDDAEVEHVLGRLERMAEAVQLIVISDDPRAATWAAMAGGDRAAVVRPERSSTR